MKISGIKNKLFNGFDINSKESSFLFNAIMNGKLSEIDIISILVSLKTKGETKNELIGAANVLRKKSLKIKSHKNCIDTCGTGGDMKVT